MAANLSPDTTDRIRIEMLVSNSPKRVVSQAKPKDALCFGGCGSTVLIRTRPTVYCPACRLEKKRACARLAMERQRRKRGITEVKGKIIACATCGGGVVLNRRADAKFCRPCYLKKNGLESRGRSASKRATDEGKKYANEWHRARRSADPAWRLASHMRVMLHRALGKGKAGKSWRAFVPYSLEELMAHIERQFTPGMTWEKMGSEIHVDHIVPLSSFNFQGPDDPGFQAAYALTNLRPLWARDNIRKNATRTHLI